MVTRDGVVNGRYMSTGEVARLCEVSPITVAKWIDDGILPGHSTPGGHRRVRVTDLVRFLRDHGMDIPPELESLGRRRVLAVDDDEDFLFLLEREFAQLADRYEFRSTTRGTDALVLVGAWKPDIMILDIGLPDLDGIEVCRRLGQMEEAATVSVIGVTALADEKHRRQLVEAGALACLDKADLIEGIAPIMERLLQESRGR